MYSEVSEESYSLLQITFALIFRLNPYLFQQPVVSMMYFWGSFGMRHESSYNKVANVLSFLFLLLIKKIIAIIFKWQWVNMNNIKWKDALTASWIWNSFWQLVLLLHNDTMHWYANKRVLVDKNKQNRTKQTYLPFLQL